VTRRQPHELVALPEQKWVRGDNQSTGPLLDDGCEGRVDLTFGASILDINLQPERARSILQLASLGRSCRKGWIDKHRHGGGVG
jgi:hypothetical protein